MKREELLKEILDILPANPHGRLLLPMRFGKTKVAIELIKRDNPKSILWVTPLSELAEIDIPKEFEKWKAKRYLNKLTTVTWTSLHKIKGHFDTIILDEDHLVTENNLSTFLDNSLTYTNIISMTGTDTMHESKKLLYESLNLKVLYEVSSDEAVNAGILSDYNIKVIYTDMSTVKDIESGSKNNKFLTSEKKQYEYIDKLTNTAIWGRRKDATFRILQRMRLIHNSKAKFNVAKYLINNLKGRKLFFCATSKQADELCEHSYHAETDGTNLRKFINQDIDTISMVRKGSTGVTYYGIDHLVLIQADSDKNGLSSQKIGRALLKQKDYKAIIWIIVLRGTQDESWVNSTLQRFNPDKIEHIDFKNLKL